jgi:hypothetical protein
MAESLDFRPFRSVGTIRASVIAVMPVMRPSMRKDTQRKDRQQQDLGWKTP